MSGCHQDADFTKARRDEAETVWQDFTRPVAAREQAGLLRQRRCFGTPPGPLVRYRGRTCLNFSSNDYLGLASDSRLRSAWSAAAARYGCGAGASQLVSGYQDVHRELEQQLAEHVSRARVLLFGSGYLANLGVVTALAGRDRCVYLDRLAHASLIDAAVLTRSRWRRFAHNDSQALDESLGRRQDPHPPLVATESVFSMDGDSAPLSELATVCRQHRALLLVDDAHAYGVQGPQGAGAVAAAGLDEIDAPLLTATFGKALGVYGAFVAGPEPLIETILQGARSLIYSTAPPPALAATVLRALAIVRREHWRRERLGELIEHWRSGARSRGIPLLPSGSPIQPVVVGQSRKALVVSEYLLDNDILVPAIRPPTVPEGTARLRISLSVEHRSTQLDRLLDTLARALDGGLS